MKKLFLGLLATVSFALSSNAQNGSYSKSAMVATVAAAHASYVKGMSYKDWSLNQIGEQVPAKEEEAFLKDVYGFLSAGATPETVLKNYDGKSFAALALLNSKEGFKSFTESANTNNERVCWFCLIKLLVQVACEIFDCGGPVIIPTNP